jgi:hypothetical protein
MYLGEQRVGFPIGQGRTYILPHVYARSARLCSVLVVRHTH